MYIYIHTYRYAYIYIYMYIYMRTLHPSSKYNRGGQHYLPAAMDMAKVGGPISVVTEGLYFHAICKDRVLVSGWSPIGCECFRTNLNVPCPLPTTSLFC